MTKIIGIAIVAANGVIGDGLTQPFSFAEDWARYKQVTMGHPMIVGRATHDAIGRFLPGRITIIVSRAPEAVTIPDGVQAHAVGSLAEALQLAAALDDEVYVAGGGTIYEQAWPYLTHLDLTEVHAEADGTVLFPAIDQAEWGETQRERRDQFDFVGYQRRGSAKPRIPSK